MSTAPIEYVLNVPIRRTRLPSFLLGVGALIVSSLLAVGFTGLLVLLIQTINGTVVVIVFGFVWGGLFFLSFPWQRQYARHLDLRKPGIRLVKGILTMPVTDDFTLQFKLDEPIELKFGWLEAVVANIAAPMMHTRTILTYATLSQGEQHVLLKAEDSVLAAQLAGWLRSTDFAPSTPAVRLWATDLVTLVEAIQKDANEKVLAPLPAPL